MKGLTSIELAILLAIIIVIAVAVGWYMYTTFLGATQAQAKLAVTSAVFKSNANPPTLVVNVTNPGPSSAPVQSVTLSGTTCSITQVIDVTASMSSSGGTSGSASTSSTITATGGVYVIPPGHVASIQASCSVSATPGTTLQGVLILASGGSFPFVATVTS
ncbi:sodium:proline symporter [Thermoproteus uzoniensis]|uniref:sodium:proline symporter n=1 Tax=Thermoproteus uzoniensis TaxID=184117 RepID=UPI0011E51F11|nr:sodium:proline symporter [Thermoproteus uzoniensis]